MKACFQAGENGYSECPFYASIKTGNCECPQVLYKYLSYCKKRNNKIDIIKRLCATIFLRIMRAPAHFSNAQKGRSESLRPRLAGKPPHKRFKEIPRLLPSERYPFQRRSPCRESTGLRNTRSLGKGRKAVLTGWGKGNLLQKKPPSPALPLPFQGPSMKINQSARPPVLPAIPTTGRASSCRTPLSPC